MLTLVCNIGIVSPELVLVSSWWQKRRERRAVTAAAGIPGRRDSLGPGRHTTFMCVTLSMTFGLCTLPWRF